MNKKYFRYFFSFIITFLIFSFILSRLEKNDIDIVSKQKLEATKLAYKSILDTYKLAAKKDFNYIVKDKKVLKLLKKFKYSKEENKSIYRGLLYRELYKEYEQLKQSGLRQFHFHTHEGKSLLRFHNPSNSGDELIDFRESIKIANIKKEKSFGFEGGRVFPGFRYVFPIVYEGDHLGSVEFSISFDSVEKKLKDVLNSNMYVLLMNKETTLQKVFSSKRKYFIKSDLSDDYYLENSLISNITEKYINSSLIKRLNKKLKENEEFLKLHRKHESFYIPLISNDKGYIISFLAIKDTKNKFAGYIVSYLDFKDLIFITSKYNIFIVLCFISIAVFIYLISVAIEQRYKTIRNKKELELSNKNLQNIIDNQKNIIILYENNCIKKVNKKFTDLFTLSDINEYKEFENYIIDTKEEDFLTKNKFKKYVKEKKFALLNNKMLKINNTIVKKEQIYLVNINFYNGNNSFILVLTDISELINLQKIVYTQSKIAAVGEMIGNIAHQWRQPLSVITTCISGLRFQLELNNELEKKTLLKNFDRVKSQAMYLSKTIDDFRGFFKDDDSILKEFNVKEVLDKVYDITKDSLKANYITVKIDSEEIMMFNNDSIIVQTLINIINNAKDAFKEKNINSNDRYLFITLKKQNKKIMLEVKDSAGGVDDSIIDKIFEPYFTTKHKSIGTGIGLYMTHQLITKQLKGKILVKNKSYIYENKKLFGASFQIDIPIL